MEAANKPKMTKRPVGRPRSPVRKVSVLIYLPTKADQLLENWSARLKISKSAIVEEALDRHGIEIIRSTAHTGARQKVKNSLANRRKYLHMRENKLPSKSYPSQIGHADFFWIRDCVTGIWVLGCQERFKNGKPKSTWVDAKKILFRQEEPPEEELLQIFVQAENDLLFEVAGGNRPPLDHKRRSIRKDLNEAYQKIVW